MKKILFSLLLFPLLGACTSSSDDAAGYLAFLYRYMPLPDSVDYSREFWKRNVETSLRARREMPWGPAIPEREWRHFVLPVRVNNENLDDARTIIYNELKDRVKLMPIRDAILWVNHWCHEHVTYQPSDSRTSSPLATMRSAIGRCGEESTFTVAALRAVGIPARQVYTPRWAHTDDNHAWVEAWADGQWYFMGACEPEPVLNLGWFNAPASRAILMHTKAFGNYDGPEEVMSRTACYTEINVTSNYCPVSPLRVLVTDTDGKPVPGARVDFRIYNYAEFYKLLSKQTDDAGRCSLSCGRGDLLVWAAHNGRYGFSKASVGKDEEIVLVLHKSRDYTASLDLDLIPPTENPVLPEVSDVERNLCNLELQREDSVRNAYMDCAFWHPASAESAGTYSELFQNLSPEDSASVADFLIKSRANHEVIASFLQSHPGAKAVALLRSLRSKDYRDVSAEVLEDHWQNTPDEANNISDAYSRTWIHYILCPRVSNEMLTPWRAPLARVFGRMSAGDIIRWTRDSIHIDEAGNPQHLCMSPAGVLRHRACDAHSRDIFFVAAMRSAGIPARIDEVTGKVQFIAQGTSSAWTDVDFSKTTAKHPQRGTLCLKIEPGQSRPDYFSHFSIARLTDDFDLALQDYEMNPRAVDAFFAEGMTMDFGTYLLTTGTRLANGGVLAHIEIFRICHDSPSNPAIISGTLLPDGSVKGKLELGCLDADNVTIPLRIRTETDELKVLGSFNSELRYLPQGADAVRSILSTSGRGYFVVGFLRPGDEPTNHALRDLSVVRAKLEEWGRSIILLVPEGTDFASFMQRPECQGLPANVSFGTLAPETIDDVLSQSRLPLTSARPVFFVADTFNRIVWYSQGYTIGLGEQLLAASRKL